MDAILVKGGRPLIGNIYISGAKNAALPIMATSLLTEEPVTLTNIPQLSDIDTMQGLLSHHGTVVNSILQEDQSLSLTLSSHKITNYIAPYDIVRKMRASVWVLGPLLARFGEARVSLPGGCAIGTRQLDMHVEIMEAMGATIDITQGYINAIVPNGRLKGCNFTFKKSSVGATINAILAASLADGATSLSNCAQEPEIIDLCHCLNAMGANVSGIGTHHINIIGRTTLHGAKYRILPDRIEAGTYMIAAIATRGDIKLYGIDATIIENLICKLQETGAHITINADYIRIHHSGGIKSTNISTQPYPGFATDLQAQFMSLMVLANGSSVISENIFENRFMHVPEMNRMGAQITIQGKSALVNGVNALNGAEVMASDLRASVSLVILGLCAKGITKIKRIYHLDRGYQDLIKKLSACGADIKRIHDT